jgi:hypothetical protein
VSVEESVFSAKKKNRIKPMIKITIININILTPYCDSHDFKYSALFVLNVQKQEKPDIRAFLQP